jgi:hypothetical protein
MLSYPRTRAVLSLLPLAITVAAWQLTPVVASALGCRVGRLPNQDQCFVGGVDVLPSLKLLWTGGMWLWLPALIIGGLLFGEVMGAVMRPPWGRNTTLRRAARRP